jgi:uncharacterized protein YtpQ (UPF0354 family)
MTRFAPVVLLAVASCARQEHPAAPVATSASPSASASSSNGAAPPSSGVDTSSPESFTASVLKLFQNTDAGGSWTRKDALTLTNGTGLVVNLDRLWGVCQTHADACPSEVTHFVETACEIASQASAKATPSALVALVRDKSYLDALSPEVRAKTISDPLVADLIVVYALDLGASVRGIQEHDLADAGVTRQELPRTARDNVEARLGKISGGLQCHGSDVTALKAGNYLESSRLLLSDAWAALAAATKGPIVATAPATDVILFVCKPDAVGLTKLTRLTDSFWHTAQRHVSRTLLKWSPQGWTELTH